MNLTPAQVKLLKKAADQIDVYGIRGEAMTIHFEDKLVKLLRQIAAEVKP